MTRDLQRPDPDELLKQVQADARASRRGRLKIFFGGCAGTGKTYAMLSAAHQHLKEGVDVVAGIIETHGRAETQQLLNGISILPMVEVTHKGITLKEFNLDAAKARKPDTILVDEFAHTNAPGSRHAKRWQDVEELLDAGINVYTTLNVQHLESLSDVVSGVTGIRVRETIPDAMFDIADDIVLIDITADELLKRLQEGKVYIAEQAKHRAAEHFFKKNNIIALRELALRRTTERVDAQMDAYNIREGIRGLAPVSEKVMVCVGPDALSAQLVRTAKRMAASLKASWTAVYIENARHYRLNDTGKARVESVMRMAERMGGKTVILQGDNARDELMAYARSHGITKIILGKTRHPRWKDILYGSLVDKLLRSNAAIDIYVVTGDASKYRTYESGNALVTLKPQFFAWSAFTIAACTLTGISLQPVLKPIDQALIYLIGNVIVAVRLGRGPSIMYALLSAACFNFFFIPPLYTLEIYDRSYWMTLAVMLATSLVITSFAARLRLQVQVSRQREHHTQTLYGLTRTLASTRGQENMIEVTARHIIESFDAAVTIWTPDSNGHLLSVTGVLPERDFVKEMAVLQWCFDHRRCAGRDTTTMPSAMGLYFPLNAVSGTLGVMGILPVSADKHFTMEDMSSLETIASLLSSALERANAADSAEKSKVEIEGEKLRNMLLSTVSHDLRTPLASITGAASSIVSDIDNLPMETTRDLAASIYQEANRLSHIVTNLLDVTSLESGTIKLNQQPYFIEEIIGSALTRVESQLIKHTVITHSEPDLPMVFIDALLIEQALINLLENAAKYTPAHSTVTVNVYARENQVHVEVADNGPGIAKGDEKKIFDKFYTTSQHKAARGTGLGLAICQGIIHTHGGEIAQTNAKQGGAVFTFTLPIAQHTEELPNE